MLGSPQDIAEDVETLLFAFMWRPACGGTYTWISGERVELGCVAVEPGAQDKAGGDEFHSGPFGVNGMDGDTDAKRWGS